MTEKAELHTIIEYTGRLQWKETQGGYVLQQNVIARVFLNGKQIDSELQWRDVSTEDGVVPVFGRKVA